MTRPKKQTVDYFPHDCKHGKTISILQKRYGNDGYAAWFKILEQLGSSDGHYIDCNDDYTWEFLASEIFIEPDLLQKIVDLIAKLGAIDAGFWSERIIWSENFVKRIADAYRNRVSEIPVRPDFLRKKQSILRQSDVGNPQTKLKESKVNKTKEKDISVRPPKKSETSLPDDFTISEAVKSWAIAKGFSRLEDHLEAFKDYALSRGKTYADWDSAFKRAIRENWAKLDGNGQGPRPTAMPINKADAVTLGNLAARDRLLKKYREQGE
jgi:hypothetical protein